MKKVNIGMKIDPDTLVQIDEEAKVEKRSRSDMIRIMAEDWLDRRRAQRKDKSA